MKKFLGVIMMMVVLWSSLWMNLVDVKAEIPYSTPWGAFYREPEAQNSYGRAWYDTNGSSNQHASIYFESYYTYGTYVKITYRYKPSGSTRIYEEAKSASSANGSSCVEYTYTGNGTYYNTTY